MEIEGWHLQIAVYILIIVAICIYYHITSLENKRSILRTFNLDLPKQKCYEIRYNEIKKKVLPILLDAIEYAKCYRIYYEWGYRWKIDQGHFIRQMRDYLYENRKTAVLIVYDDEKIKLEHNGIHDLEYYYYAIAVEIVNRHLVRYEHLESDFDEPFEETLKYRKINIKDWKTKYKFYKYFWDNHWDFQYTGKWIEDKNFSKTYAEGLFEHYCDPLPECFIPKW